MSDEHGFPYRTVQFTKNGEVYDPAEVAALLDMVAAPGVTDLLVLCHGWNNNTKEAEALYSNLLGLLREALTGGQVAGLADRSFAALGVLWPSKRWTDKELISGHGASLGSVVTDADLLGRLEELKAVFTDPAADAALDQAKKLVPLLEDKQTARRDFAELLLATLSTDAADDEDASTDLFALPAGEVMHRLSKPVPLPTGPAGAGRGGAANLSSRPRHGPFGSLFSSGPKGAALKLMNFTTYYTMKERSGTVGRWGACNVLGQVRDRRPDIGLHLAGHSFGARLATAATEGRPTTSPLRPASLTLLQAAFSHYGFAERWDHVHDGAFRPVVTGHLVSGPVLITHTGNDTAVGYAYPLASLLKNQVASALGDKNDRYGGLGRNGARKTPEASDGTLLEVGGTYDFSAGRLYNLNADAVIADHGDVAKPQVIYALLNAIAGAPAAEAARPPDTPGPG